MRFSFTWLTKFFMTKEKRQLLEKLQIKNISISPDVTVICGKNKTAIIRGK